MSTPLVAGIFVGGRARRMGGLAKGLLLTPSGETIVDRSARILRSLGIACVLVGEHPAYASCGIARIADDPRAEGPLGGLLALLEHARIGLAIAVACDMPYVSDELVRRLLAAPPAAVVAARRDARWEPFFARYDVATTLPVARAWALEGGRALQGLLAACAAEELVIAAAEHDHLRDWDTPEDVSGSKV